MDRFFGIPKAEEKEIVGIAPDDDPLTKISKLRQIVANKNATNSILIQKSRLYTGEGISKLQDKFMKRRQELLDLIKIVDKIKKYIKENKQDLLKKKSEDEKKIQDIRI